MSWTVLSLILRGTIERKLHAIPNGGRHCGEREDNSGLCTFSEPACSLLIIFDPVLSVVRLLERNAVDSLELFSNYV